MRIVVGEWKIDESSADLSFLLVRAVGSTIVAVVATVGLVKPGWLGFRHALSPWLAGIGCLWMLANWPVAIRAYRRQRNAED